MSVRFKARLSRTAVRTPQMYGSGAEYRHADAVFDPKSLASIERARVQISHADGSPTVGSVVPGSITRQRNDGDGEDYVHAVLNVDADTAAQIRNGTLKGISLGYSCELVADATGKLWQHNILVDHIALLRVATEQARCGEHCAVGTKEDMVTRHSDAVTIDGCSCADQDERDRVQAKLDHAAHHYGVSAGEILTELRKSHTDSAELTFEVVMAAGKAVQDRTPDHSGPASYHAPRADEFRRTGDLRDDNVFRASLAAKVRAAHTDDLESALAVANAGGSPERVAAAAFEGNSEDLNNDDAFRRALARKAKP